LRMLVVIPLLFVCESMLDPRLSEFTRFLVRWRLVPDEQVAALNAAIDRVNWWQRSWFPDALCLAAAMLPLAPVLLLKYPITDLAHNLFTGLLGL
jgi:hypothetical protein